MTKATLHMKIKSAGLAIASITVFGILLPPSAFSGICFLPDCEESIVAGNQNDLDINENTRWCENNGYIYYTSGKCPEYYTETSKCIRDSNYLKCDAASWCKDNSYSHDSCPSNQHGNHQCPNGLEYYKECLCNAEFKYYSGNCSGQNKPEGTACTDNATGTRYNQCNCYPNSAPSNYSYTCTGTEKTADGCGKYYYRCCSDTCSQGSKNYTGTYAGTTECGSTCRNCKDCTSGSRFYSGSYAGSSECGSCYYCSNACPGGQISVSCGSNYTKVYTGTNECGTSCYECQYNSDCNSTDLSCPFDCAQRNSCGKCTSCIDCPYTYTAAGCSSQCKYTGSTSCIKNGSYYYQSCGSSKCSSGQTCSGGACANNISKPKSNYCCSQSPYNRSGVLCTYNDSICLSRYGKDCYNYCRSRGNLDCNDFQSNCRAAGGTPQVQYACLTYLANSSTYIDGAGVWYDCQ